MNPGKKAEKLIFGKNRFVISRKYRLWEEAYKKSLALAIVCFYNGFLASLLGIETRNAPRLPGHPVLVFSVPIRD